MENVDSFFTDHSTTEKKICSYVDISFFKQTNGVLQETNHGKLCVAAVETKTHTGQEYAIQCLQDKQAGDFLISNSK